MFFFFFFVLNFCLQFDVSYFRFGHILVSVIDIRICCEKNK